MERGTLVSQVGRCKTVAGIALPTSAGSEMRSDMRSVVPKRQTDPSGVAGKLGQPRHTLIGRVPSPEGVGPRPHRIDLGEGTL